MNSATAGKGDPYWYEWTVGLLKVVEMLRPESGIHSVSFQVTGAKGWDDVVVRYADGTGDFIQVKHSRAGRSITFGDLIGADDQGSSLLGSLFAAWRAMKLKPGNEKCILFTNRTEGESAGRSATGVHRPPLFDFMAWLNPELARVKALHDCRPPDAWEGAWKEWLAQLAPGASAQRVAFLKSLEIRANQEDLPTLETSVLTALSETFQIPITRALPLLQALDNALRRWTTTQENVTAEDAYSAMALDGEVELEHRAPPPPAPFFPSRYTALAEIETALRAANGSPLVFLCAEPGAGKTSLISQLTNRRVSEALQGLVGLRYFAFRPITPESPLIPPDADHFVRPDRLWFSLLSQLRRGLKGKLRAYQLPLRNDLLTWPEARTHVMRIAERLGREMKHPFVIVVDGIDPAARAMRYEGTQAKDFFESLPGPDEIGDSPVRLLLAGQPPESYPEYPAWLQSPHPKIQRLGIGQLDAGDIRVLLRATESRIPAAQEEATIREIEMASHGNTLAVRFAVEETRTCNSLDELRERLTKRQLGDGLQQYYSAIWRHALSHLSNAPVGTEVALASALCLTAERLTGSLMASAFKQLGLTSEQWQVLLASLGPLIVQDTDGFRVMHNDVRVSLHGLLSNQPLAARRQGASMLADHYLHPSSNRRFAHKSLLRLLRDAGREAEWGRVFTVDWVFEAAALGIPYADMSDDCAEALRQGTVLKDWAVMLELACATETLERWEERCDSNQAGNSREPTNSVPAFLHTEAFVRPLTQWQVTDLHDLVHDAELLVASGEQARARALLERWFGGLSVANLCRFLSGLVEPQSRPGDEGPRLSMGEHQTLESLGAVCRSVSFDLKSVKPKKAVERDAQAQFEAGWVRTSCGLGPFDSLEACFANRPLRYLNNYETALRTLASGGHWSLVRALMANLRQSRDRLSSSFKAQAVWWALQSDAALDDPGWLDILTVSYFGFAENRGESLVPALALCRALSWKDAAVDPSVTADRVFAAFRFDSQRQDDFRHYRLLFRVAATMGQVLSVFHRRGAEAARAILPPGEMARLATALWDYQFNGITAHKDRDYAGQFAEDLVDLAFQLGDEHRNALLEAANPVAEKCPIDHRRESVWRLYQRSGNIPRLRAWVRRWLADDGWLWADDAGSRESIADNLLPLARQLGENDLADRVEERLRWLQITYRGNKEDSFGTPIAWFTALARIEPKSWQELGLKLWVLSEACSAFGGDNGCAWELGEALGAAAWCCGPTDVWQLLTAEYTACGTEYWFHPTANRLIGGLSQRLRWQPTLPLPARVSGGCLSVGFCRWFNDVNIKTLVRLREELLNTAGDGSERRSISDTIERLTPGEARRKPRPENTGIAASSTEAENDSLEDWLRRVEKGEEVHPRTAARLLRDALSERPAEFNELAGTILEAVGAGAPYSWAWYSSGSFDSLLEIGRVAPDDLLWKLLRAAVKYAGGGSAWTQGICRNLYCVLLSRATKHGTIELRAGLSHILEMHGRWARGGRGDLELPVIKLGTAQPIASWTELAARSLTFLLASRSAEVIESALIGIQALAAYEPKVVGQLLELADGDLWKQRWILNAAEVWSALFPREMEASRLMLETWLTTGPLHRRLQAWIVLRRLAQSRGTPLPAFPYPIPGDSNKQMRVLQPARQIMVTPVTQHGSIRFVDLHHSAESTIERVEHVTSANLDQVRSAVADRLLHAVPDDFDAEPWPARIRCSGDTRCSPLQGDLILDEAFDECLSASPLPAVLQGCFAQAYLGTEEPWILRASPASDEDPSTWPSEEELHGSNQKPADPATIRQKLFLLATQHGIAEDEMALAARVQVFTWCEDFIFLLWWEEGSAESKEVSSGRCPTTMSGRTFAFAFDDWWEPHHKRGKRPITFAVGGHQRLGLCFPEFMPARLWRSKFGWQPAGDNPLVWLAGGRPVARYERIHAVPRSTQSGHPRQALLGRWVVKRSAWESLAEAHGPFRMCDDFQRFPSNVEH